MTPTTTSVLQLDPRRVDIAAVTISAAFGLAVLIVDVESRGTDADGIDYLLLAAGCLLLLGRRRRPLVVAGTIVALRYVLIATVGAEIALVPASSFALYEIARRSDRRFVYVVALVGAMGSTATIALAGNDDPVVAEFIAEAATFLLPVAWGDATRSRDERVAALIEAEADRRVDAERIRIARDLHDIVAHAMTDISVQSGVAAHLLADDNTQARAALERINRSGRRALDDLRSMVGVLRSTDAAPLRPAPIDPDDLSGVIERALDDGIALAVETSGAFPEQAGDACVVATHRIIEEALVNVARHAGPTGATLSLAHGERCLTVVVRNDAPVRRPGPAPSTPSSGVGIIGMRERAESIGGSLTSEPTPSGGFVVTAVLPYRIEGAS
ncbi:MAG: sensor histidine kinase [Acidimicrobiales bacterium]